jgi:hypothetical protein
MFVAIEAVYHVSRSRSRPIACDLTNAIQLLQYSFKNSTANAQAKKSSDCTTSNHQIDKAK